VPTDVLRIFIVRCREVLAGGGPEPFRLSYGSGKTVTAMQPNVFPPRSGERETIILRTHGPETGRGAGQKGEGTPMPQAVAVRNRSSRSAKPGADGTK
jgi:hypothetical protein